MTSRVVEWAVADAPVAYDQALATMDAHVAAMTAGTAPERVWLLEHPPLYTAGTSASMSDVLPGARFPVFETGRGGKLTYHGPGQRVAYVMLNLRTRDNDVRKHVWRLEEWVIRALAAFGVKGERRCDRIGIWVATTSGEEKIAAIGVRVRHGITFHGVAINVNPDLTHFNGIVPCGLAGYGVTSLEKLGKSGTMSEWDNSLRNQWNDVFETAETTA